MKKDELNFYEKIGNWDFSQIRYKTENLVDWNFYEVLDTHETNFEYFDDSVDLDFTIGKRISKEVGMILGSVALLVVLIVGGFSTIII